MAWNNKVSAEMMNLGELIDALDVENFDDRYVEFDFNRLIPNDFAYYRGYHQDLALSYKENSFREAITVSEFRDICLEQIDKEHYGGIATRDTFIWIASHMVTSNYAITAVC